VKSAKIDLTRRTQGRSTCRMTTISDAEIISMIASGGSQAEKGFRLLYKQYANLIQYRLRTYGVKSEDLDDIFQETCFKLIKAASTYNGGSLSAWLTTIAKNTAQDLIFRKGYSTAETIEFEDSDSVGRSNIEDEFTERQVEDCMKQGMRAFKTEEPARCHALELQRDGYSIDEISTLIERSVAATKEFISQSKKKFRPYIEPCLELLKQ